MRQLKVRFFANGFIPPERDAGEDAVNAYLAQCSEHGIIPNSYSQLEVHEGGRFSTDNYRAETLRNAPPRAMKAFLQGGRVNHVEVFMRDGDKEKMRTLKELVFPELKKAAYLPQCANIAVTIRGESAENSLFLGFGRINPGLWLCFDSLTAEQLSVFDPWYRALKEKYHDETYVEE